MKTKTPIVPKWEPKEKPVPDNTVYRTKKGLRVYIVKQKEYPSIRAPRSEMFTVAEVSNGKRWYGYKREDLTPE